jgi:spore germination cell wall hydrolase CwlJ-like protein
MDLPIKDLHEYNQIKTLAEQTIKEFKSKKKDPTHGALFYHTQQVNPLWASPENITTIIGNHIFYKKATVALASK